MVMYKFFTLALFAALTQALHVIQWQDNMILT